MDVGNVLVDGGAADTELSGDGGRGGPLGQQAADLPLPGVSCARVSGVEGERLATA